MSKASEERSEGLVILLRHLFHFHYCPVEEISPANKMTASAAKFCEWLDSNTNMMSADEICERTVW